MMVTSKAEFFRLSQQMEFGNRLRQWGWGEFLQQFERGQVPLRVSVRNCLAGGDARVQRYRLDPRDAVLHCRRLIRERIVTPGQLILDESAPDDCVTLQAEVMNSTRFLDMRYALDARGMGMRQVYDQMQHANGLRAVTVLKERLDAPSWDNLCRILEEYQDSVVELSTYEIPVGVLGHNTLIWECRNF